MPGYTLIELAVVLGSWTDFFMVFPASGQRAGDGLGEVRRHLTGLTRISAVRRPEHRDIALRIT
jgi:hypothetical protein